MTEQQHKRKKQTDTSLLSVQIAACGVVLLIALVTRLIGGGFYDELRATFRDALIENGIVDTVSDWLGSEQKNA